MSLFYGGAVGFEMKSTLRVSEIIFDDEIPFGDEIRLDGGWVDLVSSRRVRYHFSHGFSFSYT